MDGFAFLHCSDLHIGRRFHGFSLLPDQRHALDQIVAHAARERVDAVVIAGDFFDSPTPSAEAVSVADQFLHELAACCPVLITAGNHDSPERLQFGSRLLAKSNVHIAAVPAEKPHTVMLEDIYGPIAFDLLPFLRASSVRPFYRDRAIETCQDAVASVLAASESKHVARRVLVAHQFVVGGSIRPEESESELRFVGGSGEVDASLFDGYAYVALGHLHGPQSIGPAHVIYSGSPLKYSFSEVGHHKAVMHVTFDASGVCALRALPINPLRDMLELAGSFAEVLEHGRRLRLAADLAADGYVRVILEDAAPADAANRLRDFFPYLAGLEYKGRMQERDQTYEPTLPDHDPLDQFGAFFQAQTGQELSIRQSLWLKAAMEEARRQA